MKYRIHYMKPDWFANGICHQKPDPANLSATHTFLREVDVSANDDLDDIYVMSQGEVWSPNGEARELIRSKGLGHTSMSVGDVIEDPNGHLFVVASFGFDPL